MHERQQGMKLFLQ